MNPTPKSAARPTVLLALLYLGFFAYLALSAGQLPQRLATHFGGGGQADGWMTRTGYLEFMSLFGLAFPLGLVGIFALARFLPAAAWNLPNRDYWLAPERRAATCACLLRYALWLACLILALVIEMHYTTIAANREHPPHLPMRFFFMLLGCFLAGLAIWLISFYRYFRRTD